MMNQYFAVAVFLTVALLCSGPVFGDEWQNPKENIPPKGHPKRINAGEGFAPLPLPGPTTPLRRSETKREPSPPALVGNVTFDELALKRAGRRWNTTIIDLEKWVHFTNDALSQRYRFVNTTFSKFSYDPTELPILYFTGWKSVPVFDDGTAKRLRQFLLDGGTWVIHSSCGRPEFNESIRREIAHVFPDRELAPVLTDHPIYSSFYNITQMRVRKDHDDWKVIPPYLEVVNLGTRAAIIFSPIDLSCGWNAATNPIDGGILYDQGDALKLGSNIMTYCLAEYRYGRCFADQKAYHEKADAGRDQLVLGQIVHNGDWDPTPHGLPNLLKTIAQDTTLHVQFKRMPVDLGKDDIFAFPVLYMTGQRKFQFTDAVRTRLRKYLDNGGTMLVDCAVGSSEFDKAFRDEIKLIYPDRQLKALPPEHALFTFISDTRHVEMAPQAKKLFGGVTNPRLEAIDTDGTLSVIYSRFSLSAGWERLPHAYNIGYADEDALKLGVNLLMYVVSH